MAKLPRAGMNHLSGWLACSEKTQDPASLTLRGRLGQAKITCAVRKADGSCSVSGARTLVP